MEKQHTYRAPVALVFTWQILKMVVLFFGVCWLIYWVMESYFIGQGPQTDASIGGGGAGEGIAVVFLWVVWFIAWLFIAITSTHKALVRNKIPGDPISDEEKENV